MGDVLTGVSVAAESLSLCVRAIVVLRRFYVTAKGARDELNHILQLVGRTRNRIELMKVTLIELRKSPNGSNTAIAASFVSACDRLNETLEELVREASNVVEGDSRLGIARRLKWSMRESRVGEIIQRLEQQEKEVRDSYVLINSCVLPLLYTTSVCLFSHTHRQSNRPPNPKRARKAHSILRRKLRNHRRFLRHHPEHPNQHNPRRRRRRRGEGIPVLEATRGQTSIPK